MPPLPSLRWPAAEIEARANYSHRYKFMCHNVFCAPQYRPSNLDPMGLTYV